MDKYEVYVNGIADTGQYPNRGGWAFLINHKGKEYSRGSGNELHASNMRMLLKAVLEALRKIPKNCEMEVHSKNSWVKKIYDKNDVLTMQHFDIIDEFFTIEKERGITVTFETELDRKSSSTVVDMALNEYEIGKSKIRPDYVRYYEDAEYRAQIQKRRRNYLRGLDVKKFLTELISNGDTSEEAMDKAVNDLNAIYRKR